MKDSRRISWVKAARRDFEEFPGDVQSDMLDALTLAAEGQTQTIERRSKMKDKNLELVRGSGNIYRDFGRPGAGLEQARAVMAAKIIRTLDDLELSTRDAENLTGIAHSEFSRIRNAQLRRFTLDRLIVILGKLDRDVEVSLTFKPRRKEVRTTRRSSSATSSISSR